MELRLILVSSLLFLSVVQTLADGHGEEEDKRGECSDDKCEASCPDQSRLQPVKDFNEEKLMGTWYSVRWYMPNSFTWNDDAWDYSHTFHMLEGMANGFQLTRSYRMKDNLYCVDPVTVNVTRIRPGVYVRGDVKSTLIYADYENFLVEFFCYMDDPNDLECLDVEVEFWSRSKNLRKEDECAGLEVLKNICYPNMSQFLDDYHRIDCTPATGKECDKDMAKEGHMDHY